MTILGLELATFSCMAYFLCLSQSPEVTTFHSLKGFPLQGTCQLILVRPVFVISQGSSPRMYVSLRLWEDWPVRIEPSMSLARMPG